MPPLIVTLASVHDVHRFDCGNQVLNEWLQQTARQHQKKLLSQTYVLVNAVEEPKVLGFYCINQRGLIPGDHLPNQIAKRLPTAIPALTIGRLAVDLGVQGNGYGETLLVDAMSRAKRVSQVIGSWGLFVDAKDEGAAAFYARYGFIALPSNSLNLFIPIASIPDDLS